MNDILKLIKIQQKFDLMNLKKNFLRDYFDYAKYKLFPICRSLTGDGNKKTLNLFKILEGLKFQEN